MTSAIFTTWILDFMIYDFWAVAYERAQPLLKTQRQKMKHTFGSSLVLKILIVVFPYILYHHVDCLTGSLPIRGTL